MRHRVEVSNRAVGVMMEMRDVEALAAASGEPLEDVLTELKERGLVGMALAERTVGDLIDAQEVVLNGSLGEFIIAGVNVPRRERLGPQIFGSDQAPEHGSTEHEANRIERRLRLYGGVSYRNLNPGEWFQWEVPDHLESQISNLPIGIDSRLSKAGLLFCPGGCLRPGRLRQIHPGLA